jgi:hypothetical protein
MRKIIIEKREKRVKKIDAYLKEFDTLVENGASLNRAVHVVSKIMIDEMTDQAKKLLDEKLLRSHFMEFEKRWKIFKNRRMGLFAEPEKTTLSKIKLIDIVASLDIKYANAMAYLMKGKDEFNNKNREHK